jgi:WD40 repeat protein
MSEKNENNQLIPIGSTGLVRVGNSISITNKLLAESKFQFAGDFKGKINWSFKENRKIIDIRYYKEKIACLFENNIIVFFNTENGSIINELEIPLIDDSAVTMETSNEEYLYLGTKERRVIKFDGKSSFTEVLKQKGEGYLFKIQFSQDNQLMATQVGFVVTIWPMKELKHLKQFNVEDFCGFEGMFFNLDNSCIIGPSHEGTNGWIYSCNLQNGKITDFKGHDENICNMSLNYLKGLAVTGGLYDNKVRVWDIKRWDIIYEVTMEDCVKSVALSPNGDYIIVGLLNGLYQIMDSVKFQTIVAYNHYSPQNIIFSKDSKNIFGYDFNNNIFNLS